MSFSVLEWKKGEAVFVVLALGLIFGVSAVQLYWGGVKTRDAQRKADAELVIRALEVYYDQHDVFPPAKNGRIMACGNFGTEECDWGGGKIVDDTGIVYLQRLPEDPRADKGWSYVYETRDGRQGARVYTVLENPGDADRKKNLTIECGKNVQCSWYAEK